MNFYLIRDIEDEFCNGVIIESDDLQYGARLAGDDSVDDPARVVPMILERNGGKVEVLIPGEGGRQTKTLNHGDEGYMEAVVMQLMTPLVLFRKGKVTALDSPERMTQKLWKRFANPDVEIPDYGPL